MIWVIGNKGMLGTELCDVLNERKIDFIETGHEVDITDKQALDNFISSQTEKKITCIINCSAYANVDKAESEIEQCYKINAEGTENLAKISKQYGATLIHISTDYVFDGKSSEPYTENMKINPIGVYGTSKAKGELAIQNKIKNFYIIRTAWLYGIYGKNFVKTMLKLLNERNTIKVVNDQFGTPTYARDLAHIISLFAYQIENSSKNKIPFGIYHFTNIGKTSWYEFACKINELGQKYKLIKNNPQVLPCTTSEYPTAAIRPVYSVLSKEKIINAINNLDTDFKHSFEQYHIEQSAQSIWEIPDWQTSLEIYIKRE